MALYTFFPSAALTAARTLGVYDAVANLLPLPIIAPEPRQKPFFMGHITARPS